MTDFDVNTMRNSNVAYLHRIRNTIDLDPPYQRQGEVWSRGKQQLLIDSLINRFDIPKIYFHEYGGHAGTRTPGVKYALVDGRQRLEAIWGFLDDKFALSDDIEFLEDSSVDLRGMHYSSIRTKYPDVASLLTATSIEIMIIRTDDIELIEEMFSRLNEAVPLNAAEKRNGRGGPLRGAVRELVSHDFFDACIPFGNSRYRHYDLATKFLLWSYRGHPSDAKKRQLDDFWEEVKSSPTGSETANQLVAKVEVVLDKLSDVFLDDDWLLRNIGMASVYYLLFSSVLESGSPDFPSRDQLIAFDQERQDRRSSESSPRFQTESDLSIRDRDFLEFDRLAQSPNDGSALEFRVTFLAMWLELDSSS